MSRGELTDAILRPVNDFLEVRSHLYLFLRNRLQILRMQLGLFPLTFPAPFLKSEADTPRWDVTADLLDDIHDVAAEHGAHALFVLIPAPFQVDSTVLRRYVQGYDLDPNAIDLDQPNRRLGEKLATRGLRVYDVLPAFRATHNSGQALYGTVDPHFTREGNELFANLVVPLVADLLSHGHYGPAEGSPPTRK
jgi:hypothetical protein